MSKGLLNQIDAYFSDLDTLQGPVAPDQVADLLDTVQVPSAPVRAPRKPRLWVAVAAFALVVALVGAVAWLAPSGTGAPPAVEPTVTVEGATTSTSATPPGPLPSVVEGVVGPGWWSVAASSGGGLSPEQATEMATVVAAWPGVLGVSAVSSQADWQQVTGMTSECDETAQALPPCAVGIVVLTTQPWMDHTARRLESEFDMTAITARDVPDAFWSGYLDQPEVAPPLEFDPSPLGVEVPWDTQIRLLDPERRFDRLPADRNDLLGHSSMDINHVLIDGLGQGGVLADLTSTTDPDAPSPRRIYALAWLPVDAAVVTFELSDGTRVWQRPVGGAVFFVDGEGDIPHLFEDDPTALEPAKPFVVLDRNGDVILRVEAREHGDVTVTNLRFDPNALAKAIETPLPQSSAAPVVEVPGLGTVTWTEHIWRHEEAPLVWSIVAMSDGLLGGGGGRLWSSFDGAEWSPLFLDLTRASVAASGPVTLIAGERSDGTSTLLRSDDGSTWTEVDHSALGFDEGFHFVVTTPSGLTWFDGEGNEGGVFAVVEGDRLTEVHDPPWDFDGFSRLVETSDGVTAIQSDFNSEPRVSHAFRYLGDGEWSSAVEIPFSSDLATVGDTILMFDHTDATCCGSPIRGVSHWPLLASNDGVRWVELSSQSARHVHSLEIEAGSTFWVYGPQLGGGGSGIELLASSATLWISGDGIDWRPLDVGFAASSETEYSHVHVAGNSIFILDFSTDTVWIGKVSGE